MKTLFLIAVGSFYLMLTPSTVHKSATLVQPANEPTISFSEEECKAYTLNSISTWEGIVKADVEKLKSNPDNNTIMLETAFSYYGLIVTCIGNGDEKTFNENVDEMQKLVTNLQKQKLNWSSVYALQAGIYSSIMAFKPSKGMTLGGKNAQSIEKAIKADDTNPLAWMQQGGSKFHTPKQFGGSIPESVACYEKAVYLFETGKNLENNWLYLYSLAWLGQAYTKNEQLTKAKMVYEKALGIAPEFGWIKYDLLPKVKAQLASN